MVDFDFYGELLEGTDSMDVSSRDMELFMADDDIDADFWTRIVLEGDGRKYRVTVTEDHSPRFDRTDYELKVSEKRPLTVEDGWTNWRRVGKENYEGFKQSSFKSDLVSDLSEYLPVEETEEKQSKLG